MLFIHGRIGFKNNKHFLLIKVFTFMQCSMNTISSLCLCFQLSPWDSLGENKLFFSIQTGVNDTTAWTFNGISRCCSSVLGDYVLWQRYFVFWFSLSTTNYNFIIREILWQRIVKGISFSQCNWLMLLTFWCKIKIRSIFFVWTQCNWLMLLTCWCKIKIRSIFFIWTCWKHKRQKITAKSSLCFMTFFKHIFFLAKLNKHILILYCIIWLACIECCINGDCYKYMFEPLNLFDMSTTMFHLYWRRKADYFQEQHQKWLLSFLLYHTCFQVSKCWQFFVTTVWQILIEFLLKQSLFWKRPLLYKKK